MRSHGQVSDYVPFIFHVTFSFTKYLRDLFVSYVTETNTDIDKPQESLKNENGTEQIKNESSDQSGYGEQSSGTIAEVYPDSVIENGDNLAASIVDKDGDVEEGDDSDNNGNIFNDDNDGTGCEGNGSSDSSLIEAPMSRLNVEEENRAL